MKEKLSLPTFVVVIFLAGCLFGAHSLYLHLKIDSALSNHAALQKGVEGFAKQVNDEFKKRPVKDDKK